MVVLAIPFTVLRTVELDVSLGVPAAQQSAIDLLGYGTNAKMMVGFDGRPWIAQGSSGTSYSDLTNHQTTWETNRAGPRPRAACSPITPAATVGSRSNQGAVQQQAAAFLGGSRRRVIRAPPRPRRAGPMAPSSRTSNTGRRIPLTLGSYTCYRPGQFTSIAGLRGPAVGNLHFAGEHTNSFYEWQGFMEGAALSGLDVAAAILRVGKKS